MKVFVFIVFVTLFASGLSSVSHGKYADPAHPGKCVVHDLILSPGETGYPKGKCIRAMCVNADGSTTIHACGRTTTDLPCVVGKQKYPNEPYPKCCEMEIICPEGVEPTRITRTG